ncbi:class I SAM-dependent methyltransferase [Spirosoma foliorum]|uniref:Class I SAM-dependent methyltransferase n=1 Tax=Spirosoma foliorum TaxID=2710596 RepID=A0A7G5H627_9BACT|nr:class I SAM-dependent methyltransferase [Spirosoma foliorum]QMW06569.1 class I SAM-dependent methyltransferase [Spirosoma foliorum]
MMRYLDYLAQQNKPYLHAKGELATEHLIQWLDCQPEEQILEFGVGTGGTLVKVVSRYRQTTFWAVDKSKIMIKKASKRLAFCLLKDRATIKRIGQNQLNDFADNSFDKVYVESVLGIQNGPTLCELIAQFSRLLKPAGKLIFNETIWLMSTDMIEATAFNISAIEQFGLPQASTDYPYLNDWKALLEKHHFTVLKIEKVDVLNRIQVKEKINEKLSHLFTTLGNLYGKMFLMKRTQIFEQSFNLFASERKLMEGYLVMALNNK